MKTKCISQRSTVVVVAVLSFACLTALAQDYRVLHHFAGGANDGATPCGGLIQSGSVLYGMTSVGGRYGNGTVFFINTNDNVLQVLHSFAGGANDGAQPLGSLIQSGTNLYGMTYVGGNSGNGTVFQIDTDNGTGFKLLHTFAGPPSDGRWPYGSLIQSGSTLYGMTVSGGQYDNSDSGGSCYGGTVFQIDTNNGINYQILHHFAAGSADGQWAPGNLTQSGSTLYGMTDGGGSPDLGTIFKMTNGTGFKLLHVFTGTSNDGSHAHSSVLLSGSMLYGMTEYGGTAGQGAIFQIDTNGNGFALLHSFTGSSNDGAKPYLSSFIQSGAILYGTTQRGGSSNLGIVFQINTNGTFQLLHSFTGADGATPYTTLLMSGSTLYGMTKAGGSQGKGVIFALDLFPKIAVALSGTNLNLSWSTNYPGFVLEGIDQLNGTWTSVPGVTGCSATLPVNADSQFFRLRK